MHATIIHQTARDNYRVIITSRGEVVSNRLFASVRDAEDYVAETGTRHISHAEQ